MSTIVIASDIDDPPLEIPGDIVSLDDFRKWAFSHQFPQSGRIDFVQGRIEVDMAADDLFTHNLPKTALTGMLWRFVEERKLGWVFSDGARMSIPGSDLSVEPDLIFLSHESCEQEFAKFRRSRSKSHPGYVEIVGPVDLVVEIISDSSVRKVTLLLPAAYFAAGVKELWLLDCRGRSIRFDVLTRGARKFRSVKETEGGWKASQVMSASFRLTRTAAGPAMWHYGLEVGPPPISPSPRKRSSG